MSVPNTFASATSAIPLANLDADFAYYDAAFQIAAGVMEVNYTFRLEDPTDNTKKAEFVMSGITTGTTRQYTLPNVTGSLATLGNISQTFTGSVAIVPATNGSAITIGAIPQTGTITLGRSTAAQTVDIAVGATAAATTKTVNIGTTGVSTSVTNINYGSAVTGALNTHIWNAGANNMRLDSSGNLGLGVTPSGWGSNYKVLQGQAGGYALSNDGTQNNQMRLSSNAYNNGTNWIYYGTSLATSYEQRVGEHRWYNAPSGTAGSAITFTQAMTLDASGNLLVGTTTTAFSNTNAIALSAAQGYVLQNHISGSASGTTYTYFAYNATQIGSITQNGTTGVLYNISSDYRLKNITGPITTSGAYIDSLKPVEGTWKADGSTFVGLIAHETQEVSRTTVATGTKDGEQMQGMDYSSAEIIANLIAELQSLRARVAQLESK